LLKLYTAIYLGFWIALAVVVAYLGNSPWLSVGAVFITFFFVNGSLAYVLRSRQLRREGKTPPRYLAYLFQTHKIGQPTIVPAPIRITLGSIVILGGALFVFGGGVFVVGFDRLAVFLVGCLFLLLGAAFVYVGYRVIRMNQPNRRLFGSDHSP
jgi:hypothetical protein